MGGPKRLQESRESREATNRRILDPGTTGSSCQTLGTTVRVYRKDELRKLPNWLHLWCYDVTIVFHIM